MRHEIDTKCDCCKNPYSLEVEIPSLPYVFTYNHQCFKCGQLNKTVAEFSEPFVVTEVNNESNN